jgi:glucose-1-phosphate thymidylyltransferase
VLDENNRVLEFAEKPQEPKSAWGVPPLYLYPRETLPRIHDYLANGGNPDAPGHFVEWLSRAEPVYAYKMNGNVLDIGNLESLEAARRLLS